MNKNVLTVKAFVLGLILILVSGAVTKAQQTVEDAKLFDQIEGPNWENAMARLDGYAIDLQRQPDTTGVIIVYGGQHRQGGEARAWSRCVKDYLVNRRGISTKKILVVNGGFRESLTVELWSGFRKGNKATVKPSPTIKGKDVRFSGGKIKAWRSLCNI